MRERNNPKGPEVTAHIEGKYEKFKMWERSESVGTVVRRFILKSIVYGGM